MEIEKVGGIIVDSAIKVHKALRPGLLESSYPACLAYELVHRCLQVACEVPFPINYEGQIIETGYRIDMLVNNCVIIENKAVDQIHPIHEAQLLTYLKLSGIWLGFILNWNTYKMKAGIKRMVNGLKPA
jgi:GxxExxY protein